MAAARPFSLAVTRFKRSARGWLTPADAPAVTALVEIARLLDDGDPTPAMLAQFGLTYRSLLKREPTASDPEDAFEAALREDGV